jgi:NAD(P)H-dependent FMN reductase
VSAVRPPAFAGSLPLGSSNRRLLVEREAAARESGAAVDVLDRRRFALPVCDADLAAEGMPTPVCARQARPAASLPTAP